MLKWVEKLTEDLSLVYKLWKSRVHRPCSSWVEVTAHLTIHWQEVLLPLYARRITLAEQRLSQLPIVL